MPLRNRRAFTLIEILVVITIIIVLTVLVVSVYNMNAGGDKIRSAARTAQSAFLGARDRALHAKAARGIRLIRDPSDLTLVTGFAYIQPMDVLQYGPQSIELLRRDESPADNVPDPPGDVVIVHGFVDPGGSPPKNPAPPYVDWYSLTDFFSNPARIRIPAGTGQWYTFTWTSTGKYALTSNQAYLQLTSPFTDPGAPGVVAHDRSSGNSSCEIELSPELLPNHAPISLPSGVVIDLDFSSLNVNTNWPAGPPSTNINLMFSPRGMVTGPLSALGPIHFLLNDVQDATQGLNPIDSKNKGQKLILTIFPQTGNVATYPIDPTDLDGNGTADDLFRFAKLGSTAGN